MKICILGGGAYGTALATVLNKNKQNVTIWTKFEEEKNELDIDRKCSKLNNITIEKDIKITTNLNEAVLNSDIILFAIPAGFIESVAIEIKPLINDQIICIASKGIENESCLFLNEVIQKHINTEKIAVISGPSFAIDVAKGYPVGLTLATKNKIAKEAISNAFSNENFKLRISDDIIGTEICGAIKNIIAIASGMLDGMKMPESTLAFLITESIHDIKNLIVTLGGNEKTILSFAGIGDLLLTATSEKSRNYSFGKLLGENKSKIEIDNYIKNTTIEGLYTLNSVIKLTNKKGIDVPIINLIYDIIYKEKSPKELLNFLINK